MPEGLFDRRGSRVTDFRTVFFGPGRIVVTADVVFDDDIATTRVSEYVTQTEAGIVAAVEKVSTEDGDGSTAA